MEVKKRRKTQEKAIKRAEADAAGRDVEAERRVMEENRKEGTGWAKREEKWKAKFAKNASPFEICVDCAFEPQMTDREISSLGSQIRFCYSANKKAKHPVRVTLASLSGKTREYLTNVSGFDQWANRGLRHSNQSLMQLFPDPSKLVYLTSDSDNELEALEEGKVYIIGGIVDRNRLTRVTIDRARELGVVTARLPIAKHLDLVATKVLAVNHVFEILVRLREHNSDWKKTLLNVLPERKDAKDKSLVPSSTADPQN